MPSSYLPYLFLLQIIQNVLKNNWITNQVVIFSHCTSITELILKIFHACSGFSLQLDIKNCVLFKRLSSCTDIHMFPLTALSVECLKFWCRVACRKRGTRSVSHVGVQVPCTVTIILVSAPLCKWDLRTTLPLLSHPPSLTLSAATSWRNSPVSEHSLCLSPPWLYRQLRPPVVQSMAVLKLQVGLHPLPKADLGKRQNFWKPRRVRVEQMLTALYKQCSSITSVNIPSHCLAAGILYPKCHSSASLQLHQLPHAPALTHHRTEPFHSLKWWKSFQILLFPHTHLSVCRSSLGHTRQVSRRGSVQASPCTWWHVMAVPLHSQPTTPSALSAASLYMLQ